MKAFKQMNVKAIITQFKTESISMRRRFYFFIMSAIAIILCLILLLFNLFGIMLILSTLLSFAKESKSK